MQHTEAGPRHTFDNYFFQAYKLRADAATPTLERDTKTIKPTYVENKIQSTINLDLRQLQNLQKEFDRALGREYDPQDLLQRSYNPVIDVMHIRQLRVKEDKEGEASYFNEISLNMETNLRERYKLGASEVKYRIDGDELYSEHFPLEPFSTVLDRGVQYRQQHNTPEAEREGDLGEQAGWEKIRKKFTDPKTAVGTKMTAFSPPGLVEDTAYRGNFVDEYELVKDEAGEKYVKLTRYAVDFDQAEYDKSALSLDPKFFDGYDGRPWDAWMLAHPVEGAIPDLKDRQVGEQVKIPDIMTGKLLSFLNYYKEAVGKEPIDWIEVALAFNAFLNLADNEKEALEKGKPIPMLDFPISEKSIKEEVGKLGRQEVKTIYGGGCPPNKGFNLSSLVGLNRGGGSFVREPGASKFSTTNPGERTLHCKSCPICGALEIDAVITTGRIVCPVNGCSAPYAC